MFQTGSFLYITTFIFIDSILHLNQTFIFLKYRQKVGGITDEGDYYRFLNGRYDEKGFTYRNFSINALVSSFFYLCFYFF